MYESGYNKLFWGMIFVIFNINSGAINYLPNFIGYILIISGLNILLNQHDIYKKAIIPTAILIILTLKDIANLGSLYTNNGQFEIENLWIYAVGAIETILDLYVIYTICKGIYLLSEQRDITELKNSAKERFIFYLVMQVIYLFYVPFSINLKRGMNTFMVLAAVINAFAALLIAGLFRKSRILLRE